MKQPVLNTEGKKVGDVELAESVFGEKVNKHLVYEVVKWQMASRRSGTAHTKVKSEVRGSTAKIYRQKGTGRARHGQARTTIFVGGPCTFGPRTKDYGYTLPKQMKAGGLKSALSMKLKEEKIKVVDAFKLSEPKTKKFLEIFENLKVKSGLVLVDDNNEKLTLAGRNLKKFKILNCNHINVYDLLAYDHAVFTAKALEKVQERLS